MGDEEPLDTDVGGTPDTDRWSSRRDRTSVEAFHRLLAAPRRRIVLTYLSARSGDPVQVSEVRDVVVQREEPERGPGSHRERVAIDLHHVHLPTLADAGVVDYDPVDQTVRYDGSETLETLLAASNSVAEGDDDPRGFG